jgi:hypothetical protein
MNNNITLNVIDCGVENSITGITYTNKCFYNCLIYYMQIYMDRFDVSITTLMNDINAFVEIYNECYENKANNTSFTILGFKVETDFMDHPIQKVNLNENYDFYSQEEIVMKYLFTKYNINCNIYIGKITNINEIFNKYKNKQSEDKIYNINYYNINPVGNNKMYLFNHSNVHYQLINNFIDNTTLEKFYPTQTIKNVNIIEKDIKLYIIELIKMNIKHVLTYRNVENLIEIKRLFKIKDLKKKYKNFLHENLENYEDFLLSDNNIIDDKTRNALININDVLNETYEKYKNLKPTNEDDMQLTLIKKYFENENKKLNETNLCYLYNLLQDDNYKYDKIYENILTTIMIHFECNYYNFHKNKRDDDNALKILKNILEYVNEQSIAAIMDYFSKNKTNNTNLCYLYNFLDKLKENHIDIINIMTAISFIIPNNCSNNLINDEIALNILNDISELLSSSYIHNIISNSNSKNNKSEKNNEPKLPLRRDIIYDTDPSEINYTYFMYSLKKINEENTKNNNIINDMNNLLKGTIQIDDKKFTSNDYSVFVTNATTNQKRNYDNIKNFLCLYIEALKTLNEKINEKNNGDGIDTYKYATQQILPVVKDYNNSEINSNMKHNRNDFIENINDTINNTTMTIEVVNNLNDIFINLINCNKQTKDVKNPTHDDDEITIIKQTENVKTKDVKNPNLDDDDDEIEFLSVNDEYLIKEFIKELSKSELSYVKNFIDKRKIELNNMSIVKVNNFIESILKLINDRYKKLLNCLKDDEIAIYVLTKILNINNLSDNCKNYIRCLINENDCSNEILNQKGGYKFVNYTLTKKKNN